jgi:hypothetical protein
VTLEIKELAREHGPEGVARLAEIAFDNQPLDSAAVKEIKRLCEEGTPSEIAKYARSAFAARSDMTCVAAIKELFDRGYGKAIQPIAGDSSGGPIRYTISWE